MTSSGANHSFQGQPFGFTEKSVLLGGKSGLGGPQRIWLKAWIKIEGLEDWDHKHPQAARFTEPRGLDVVIAVVSAMKSWAVFFLSGFRMLPLPVTVNNEG